MYGEREFFLFCLFFALQEFYYEITITIIITIITIIIMIIISTKDSLQSVGTGTSGMPNIPNTIIFLWIISTNFFDKIYSFVDYFHKHIDDALLS